VADPRWIPLSGCVRQPDDSPPPDDADRLQTPLGAHVSIAGGTGNAPPRAKSIGATAIQIFTKMASRWAERVCEEEECTAFVTGLGETGVRESCGHDSYLINLASPDPVLRQKSLESFVKELERCAALKLRYLVSHPGNFMDDRASGLQRNADAISEALERTSGNVVLLLEMTAGAGTVLGSTFEEMATLIEKIPLPHRDRVGVCVDTAHIFAAGYDIVNDYDGVWARFDDVIGRSRLRMMHLNDSKVPLGSKRDRHELIGEGAIGEGAFRRIMNDDRLASVGKIIETPKLGNAEVTDRRMIERLRGYIE
jgi:deoxyribonuclease IV